MEVVTNSVPPLWDRGELWFKGGELEASAAWWETPTQRLQIIQRWAEGARAEDCGHVVALTWAAELVCPRYGVLTMWGVGISGSDPGRPLAPTALVGGMVFLPPPPYPRTVGGATFGVERPQGVTC